MPLKHSRECMYCKHFFKCDGKEAWVDSCLRFEAKDEDAQKRYEEMRKKE